MSKNLRAVDFDGTTFGMEIETNTIAYRKFKKEVKCEKVISVFGTEVKEYTVPYLLLAAIMREAQQVASGAILPKSEQQSTDISSKTMNTPTSDVRILSVWLMKNTFPIGLRKNLKMYLRMKPKILKLEEYSNESKNLSD